MKELETNEHRKVLAFKKRVAVAIVGTIVIIITIILILIKETTFLTLLTVPLFILLMCMLYWVINPYGECCYRANKFIIQKDKFIVYLENGDVCYFPFSRIVKAKCVGRFPTLMIILEKGILNISIHLTIYGGNYVDYTFVTKIVARRLGKALEKYKNSNAKTCEKD
ncbi:hypothetical protein [Fusobacterium sp. PH5-44]|uniref:hypothetical protein n=1 Tax=unclassified Fusobacterium TaxID=2648384 RepID=UPI003D23D91D